ncbi:winged helix-turn-helix transcriptional regulator [Nonomuraea turkmeniaca]|uniref:winged helix-turn-helix transcriptional regulator n=1 Tax=Nonomuraea turkmeniaca TaxID=103838 RepID=UPI001B87D8CE|nr:winged helix-turn-helix transcriptional regulator [Nonomuraea turkmeniaca]
MVRSLPRKAPSLLAARLRELQRAGLVQRHIIEGEPRYRLTPAGQELQPLLQPPTGRCRGGSASARSLPSSGRRCHYPGGAAGCQAQQRAVPHREVGQAGA